jgi:hypothetical protein
LIGGGWNVMRAFAGVGDLSGDGRNDLVVSDSSGKLWLYPGNGRGWFGTRTMIGTGGWGPFTTLLGYSTVPTDSRPGLLAVQSVAPDGLGGEVRFYRGLNGGRLAAGEVNAFIDCGDALR